MTAFRRLLSATAILLAFAAPAALAQGFTEGKDYFRIEPAQPTSAPGKVEVLEAFSYGCGACATVHPFVESWKKKMPAGAAFAYMPATFRPDFALLARGYYAAEALGALESTHAKMFEAVRNKGRIASIEDVADLYAGLGVDRAAFLAAASSFAVNAKVKRATQALPRYGVDSTPSFIVAGKYRVTGQSAGSYDRLFQIIDFLLAREAAAAAG
jgi:thiol:disulfide interchange protein DsbA